MKGGIIASADQDILPANVPLLINKYNALAGDWESSAIAHISKKNNIKCYIIRGITDVVYTTGSETYGNMSVFERETEKIMGKLLHILEIII
jgi:nucleoside phosphorylase